MSVKTVWKLWLLLCGIIEKREVDGRRHLRGKMKKAKDRMSGRRWCFWACDSSDRPMHCPILSLSCFRLSVFIGLRDKRTDTSGYFGGKLVLWFQWRGEHCPPSLGRSHLMSLQHSLWVHTELSGPAPFVDNSLLLWNIAQILQSLLLCMTGSVFVCRCVWGEREWWREKRKKLEELTYMAKST